MACQGVIVVTTSKKEIKAILSCELSHNSRIVSARVQNLLFCGPSLSSSPPVVTSTLYDSHSHAIYSHSLFHFPHSLTSTRVMHMQRLHARQAYRTYAQQQIWYASNYKVPRPYKDKSRKVHRQPALMHAILMVRIVILRLVRQIPACSFRCLFDYYLLLQKTHHSMRFKSI